MSYIFHKRRIQNILLVIAFFVPFKSFSQDISGLWTGRLYNDTTREYIPFELLIDESGGKITGFSQTSFDDGKGKNIGIKSQKIKFQNGELKTEDENFVYNNFPGGAPKGVKMFSEMVLKENKGALTLTGMWRTNPTKMYRPLTGTVYLERKKEKPEEASIVKNLIKLGKEKQVAFLNLNADQKNATVSAAEIAKAQKSKDDSLTYQKELDEIAKAQKEKDDSVRHEQELENIAKVQKAKDDSIRHQKELEDVAKAQKEKDHSLKKIKEQEDIAKTQKAKDDSLRKLKEQEAIVLVEKAKDDSLRHQKELEGIAKEQKAKDDLAKQQEEKLLHAKQAKEELALQQKAQEDRAKSRKEQDDLAKQQLAKNELEKGQKAKEELVRQQKARQEQAKVQNENPKAASDIAKRKIETIRTVEITQDSVVFSLYDNGTVDGDTVTVLINGKVVMPRVGLLATAINKTIYLTPEMGDSISVVMYAENLGSIPPNTGLLVIREAKRIYEIRFSGDLQKNSAIILTRKKKE